MFLLAYVGLFPGLLGLILMFMPYLGIPGLHDLLKQVGLLTHLRVKWP